MITIICTIIGAIFIMSYSHFVHSSILVITQRFKKIFDDVEDAYPRIRNNLTIIIQFCNVSVNSGFGMPSLQLYVNVCKHYLIIIKPCLLITLLMNSFSFRLLSFFGTSIVQRFRS